jgi:hypothetical protein
MYTKQHQQVLKLTSKIYQGVYKRIFNEKGPSQARVEGAFLPIKRAGSSQTVTCTAWQK